MPTQDQHDWLGKLGVNGLPTGDGDGGGDGSQSDGGGAPADGGAAAGTSDDSGSSAANAPSGSDGGGDGGAADPQSQSQDTQSQDAQSQEPQDTTPPAADTAPPTSDQTPPPVASDDSQSGSDGGGLLSSISTGLEHAAAAVEDTAKSAYDTVAQDASSLFASTPTPAAVDPNQPGDPSQQPQSDPGSGPAPALGGAPDPQPVSAQAFAPQAEALSKDQILQIMGQSSDPNDLALRLGLGPVGPDVLSAFLAHKGVSPSDAQPPAPPQADLSSPFYQRGFDDGNAGKLGACPADAKTPADEQQYETGYADGKKAATKAASSRSVAVHESTPDEVIEEREITCLVEIGGVERAKPMLIRGNRAELDRREEEEQRKIAAAVASGLMDAMAGVSEGRGKMQESGNTGPQSDDSGQVE